MEVKVVINPDGTYQVDVKGVKGKKCVDLTAAFESALGKVHARTKTPEYFQTEQRTVKQGASGK